MLAWISPSSTSLSCHHQSIIFWLLKMLLSFTQAESCCPSFSLEYRSSWLVQLGSIISIPATCVPCVHPRCWPSKHFGSTYISSSSRADDEHGPSHERVQEGESRHPESYRLLPVLNTHHTSQKILPLGHLRLTDARNYVQITVEKPRSRENSPLREQDQWHQYLENDIPATRYPGRTSQAVLPDPAAPSPLRITAS
jgi:hypothetical protein